MADITPAKTWGNEDLFPADLNTEFTNVYANHVSKSTAQTISGVKTFSAGPILQDSVNLTFGTGSDATIDYDGTNLVIAPAVVGSGIVHVSGGAMTVESTDNAAASVIDGLTVEWDPADDGNMTDTSSGLAIAFTLPDDADNQDVMGRVQLIVNDDASGSEDTEWQFMRMVAGTLTAQSLGTTINNATENELVTVASSTDELDAEANLTWDGSSMGVGIASPDGTLHVHTGSAGSVTAATNADDLVVEVTSSQNGGISILSGASDIANLTFGSPTNNEEAYVRYDHNNGKMILSADRSGSGGSVNVLGGPMVGLQEDANANMTTGLTINQGANDDEILALKSSDVAHGATGATETDTYGAIQKASASAGGLMAVGYGEGATGTIIRGNGDTLDTTDTTASRAAIELQAGETTTAAPGAADASDDICSVRNWTTTRVLFKGDGTVHASDTSWATALDDMPDAIAARAYTTSMAEGGLVGGMEVHAPELVQKMEEAGIVTAAEKPGEGSIPGHRFLNLQKGIKFSWDMGFQNMTFLYHLTKVLELSDEQVERLPQTMRDAFHYIEQGDPNRLLEN